MFFERQAVFFLKKISLGWICQDLWSWTRSNVLFGRNLTLDLFCTFKILIVCTKRREDEHVWFKHILALNSVKNLEQFIFFKHYYVRHLNSLSFLYIEKSFSFGISFELWAIGSAFNLRSLSTHPSTFRSIRNRLNS